MVAGAERRNGGTSEGSPADEGAVRETSAVPPFRRSAPILVLVNPQDIVNIASAVRIARNFGIERMRLVNPETFDPWRIEGIAHNSADFVAGIELVDSLEAAVADCVHVAVLTARGRTAKRRTVRPREAAAELVSAAATGSVAMVVGREDRGLTNAELDLGHVLVTIPTDPGNSSLNLAQAVAIMAYESWIARGGETAPLKPPRKDTPPATSAQLEELFGDWRRALWAVDFFKTRRSDSVMRSFREIVHRAALDGREASLVRAMGIEVVRYLARAGLTVSEPPVADPS
jgi:TrmH family RNA methyltransferase